MDITVSAVNPFAITSPLLLTIALAIKIENPSLPIIFKQRRCGLNGKEVIVWKFRTMTVLEDGQNIMLATKGDKRITRLGAFLRKTSLDEFPQFVNSLAGTLSIVGPRPHALHINDQYRDVSPGYMRRHLIKPGITGWAQINGWRGETDTEEKILKRTEFDLFYLHNWSVWLDIKIVLLTALREFNNKKVY